MENQYLVVINSGILAVFNKKTGKTSYGRKDKGFSTETEARNYISELIYWRERCGY